jgi:2-haloacid dehalogenase
VFRTGQTIANPISITMAIDTIIFDLGNVLIDWNPGHLFDKVFSKKEEKDYFFQNVCTDDWHAQQDAGRSTEEATEELVKQHPKWEHAIRAFYSRWKEMFGGEIEGSVEILKELKEKGYRLYALTNWSAELFQRTYPDYPFLHWFEGIVMSGEEKVNKPDERIYQVLLERYHINPDQALFIDDKEKNVRTAERIGIRGIVFKSPNQLREELRAEKLL